jgi:glutathione S-transferase
MSLNLYQHPFAMYCWKPLIALYERELVFTSTLVEDRSELASLWPPASIPVLVDDGLVIPESSAIIEQLDRHGDAPPMVPADPDAAIQARIWDRVVDGQVATPVQTIVADALRPEDAKDPYGVTKARQALAAAYATLDRQLTGRESGSWLSGESFSLSDCAAAPALHYADLLHRIDADEHQALDAYYRRLLARASVARVIDEARPYRQYFPLEWAAHVI